jgi:phenylalanyl-tRNA synthetase beta chain
VPLVNPMSEDHAVLRTTVLGSLLDAARHNTARGAGDLSLFEQGAVYFPREDDTLPHEHRALGGLLTGHVVPPTWGEPSPPEADFFAVKALLGAVLDTLRVDWSVGAPDEPEPFLHPGRSARVIVSNPSNDEIVGWVGELHPLVAREWALEGPVGVFEVDLDRVVTHAVAVPTYRDLTSFPRVRQDLAVVVDDDVTAATVLDSVREAAGPLLRDVRIFDVYRGAQVGEGRKSLALALTFQAADRTLTDEDVGPVRDKVVTALTETLGGELRG